MTQHTNFQINPKLDLVLERTVDVPPALIWKAWTTPEHLKPWFCPKPWSLSHCEIDLRPGGRFYSVMKSPEGQEYPNEGCYLETVENQRLVWTNAMLPGFRPAPSSDDPHGFFFTAALLLQPQGSGTKYTAIAIHKDESGRKTHAEMGFQEGWGTVLTQLVEYIKSGQIK